MTPTLMHAMRSVWFMMLVSSTVICGRVPVGIGRIDLVEDYPKSYQFSEEYLDLDTAPHHEDTAAVYITDEQINELQNEQETIRQDQEIYHVDPRCPKFNGLCAVPTCSADTDCQDKICCYNGCVHTCVEDKSPPIAIDWIPLGEEKVALVSDHRKGTITIPGGCRVTWNQRLDLDLFLKYGHVTKCLCVKGDVLCHVRKRYPSLSLADSRENGSQVPTTQMEEQ